MNPLGLNDRDPALDAALLASGAPLHGKAPVAAEYRDVWQEPVEVTPARLQLTREFEARVLGVTATNEPPATKPKTLRQLWRQQQANCAGKRRYDKRGAATQLRLLRAKPGSVDLRIYPCPVCKGWHLSKDKRE